LRSESGHSKPTSSSLCSQAPLAEQQRLTFGRHLKRNAEPSISPWQEGDPFDWQARGSGIRLRDVLHHDRSYVSSRNRGGQRLQGMTSSLVATDARPIILTTSQLEMVQRVWQLAGWPPLSGYGIVALGATVAVNGPLAATLTSVDFDDASSVANAVRVLHDSRAHTWK
jgi:hypothetical protein